MTPRFRPSIAAFVLGVAGCGNGSGIQPDAGPDGAMHLETVDTTLGGLVPVDILLVVDNSGSMAPYQQHLGNLIHRLTDALSAGGQLPDLHLGVVSSDLGALGTTIGDPACDNSDDGQLLTNGCAGIAPDTFLTDVLDPDTGNRVKNYTGALAVAAECMVNLGSAGCGFEQHFEAMRLALMQPGFVRDEADLAVLFFADEDDCSAYNPAFFGPETAALGPLDSFRCFEFGVECAPDDPRGIGVKSGCVSREDSPHIHPVSRYVDFLEQLKGDGAEISVGMISGDSAPVEVGRRTPPGGTPRPDLLPSCMFDMPGTGMEATADPAVRFGQLLAQFVPRAVIGTACAADYPELTELGELAHREARTAGCFDGAVVEGECEVRMMEPGEAEVSLVQCNGTAGNPPCWRIESNATVCPDGAHHLLDVVAVGTPPIGTRVTATCMVL